MRKIRSCQDLFFDPIGPEISTAALKSMLGIALCALVMFPLGQSLFVPLAHGASFSQENQTITEKKALEDLDEAKKNIQQKNDQKALKILKTYAQDPLRYPIHSSDYIALLTWNGKKKEAITLYEALPPSLPKRIYLKRAIARAYYDTGQDRKALELYMEILKAQPDDEDAGIGALRGILLLEPPAKMEAERKRIANLLSQEQLEKLALWPALLLRTGHYQQGYAVYQRRIATFQPAQPEGALEKEASVNIHRLRICQGAVDEQLARAQKLARQQGELFEQHLLESIIAYSATDRDALFAVAFVYEQEKRYQQAIDVYDYILEFQPENVLAQQLRSRAFSRFGATGYAMQLAKKERPADLALQNTIIADSARQRTSWGEPKQALELLASASANHTQNLPFRFAEIIALNAAKKTKEAIEKYEQLPSGVTPPDAVKTAVASSYLFEEQPVEALRLFEEVYQAHPKDIAAQTNTIITLQELRSWNEAGKRIDQRLEDLPPYSKNPKKRKENAQRQSAELLRAWFLVYQNRLQEAQPYLWNLHKAAPADTGTRNALAHLWLWRGWKRRAMEEFDVLFSMDPETTGIQTGRIATMNQMGQKKEAREQAALLVAEHPQDKNIQNLQRMLEVEDMNDSALSMHFSQDENGNGDLILSHIFSTPYSLYTSLQTLLYWRKSWQDINGQENDWTIGRIGLGLDHEFNQDWSLHQEIGVDWEDADDVGSKTAINWTPDDYWHLAASYDSFVVDIPRKALQDATTAEKFSSTFRYRASEWRECSLDLSWEDFSDGNTRREAFLSYEQNLFIRNDWRMRTWLSGYYSQNSAWDDPKIAYFNPKNGWSISLTQMTEQVLRDIYHQYFAHRLYLSIGTYKQYNYDADYVGSIKYEHEYTFSDTHALVWSASYDRNLYDGEHEDSYGFTARWRLRF